MMENQITSPKPYARYIFLGLVCVGIIVWVFFLKREDKLFLIGLVKNGSPTNLVETIKKEINNPGALIAKIESDRSNLTLPGVLDFTNRARKEEGLKPLIINQKLSVVAGKRMNDMFARGYFEHVSPIGESASTVADDVSYDYITIGENIAMGNFADDQALVLAWMNSPGHRANIVHIRYTEIGIAVGKALYNGKSTWIAVQIFARPLSLCISIPVNMKSEIDLRTKEIDLLQQRVALKDDELRRLKAEGKFDEYNREVKTYNALAKDVNEKISSLKSLIETYNSKVREFNSCIAQ